MMTRLKRLVLTGIWMALTSAAAAQPADVPPPPPGGQIITAADIEQAGLTRLSDLFSLLDDWYAASVEGYTWDASPNGLAPLQDAAWILLVDGQPVDLTILDAQNINTLPLSLDEIAYVEAHNTPTLVAGLFAPAGVLHLHTRRPERGGTLQGSFAAGNETGDPGPFRYTAVASPNIDRIGPTVQASAAWAGAGWHARAHFKVDEHHATDERIRRRVFDLYQGEKAPRLLLTAGGFDLGATGRFGQHSVFAGFSRFQDLPFYEPLGREGPTEHRFLHAGLRGDFAPGNPLGVSYRLAYTVSNLDPRPSQDGLDFNWRQNTLRGHYEVRAGDERMRGALGVSGDLVEGFTGVLLDDPTLFLPRAYGQFVYHPTDRWEQQVAVYVTRVDGEAGYGALARLTAHPTPQHTITLTGSVARQPYQEKNRIWYWVGEGYDFFQRRSLDVSLPARFEAGTTYTADLAWAYRPAAWASLTLGGGYRRFDDLTIPSYSFAYDSLSTGFTTATVLRHRVFGRVTLGRAEVWVRLIPWLEQRLFYAYVRYPTTDDTFFEAWRNQPWHRFSYTARYVPLARLSLFARLSYASETQWTGYRQAAAASDGRYAANLPAYWLLDVTAQKRFWGDHARLSLSLRNVLNEAYRTHPAGDVSKMVFQVKAQLYFNGGGRRGG